MDLVNIGHRLVSLLYEPFYIGRRWKVNKVEYLYNKRQAYNISVLATHILVINSDKKYLDLSFKTLCFTFKLARLTDIH